MTRFGTLLIALLAGAGLAACGEEGGAPAAKGAGATAVDACALLTAAEIDAAMDNSLSGGAPGSDHGGAEDEGRIASCSWGTDAEPAMFVTLQTYSWSDGIGAQNYMATMRSSSETDMGVPPTDVSGVGEEAFESGFGLVARNGAVNLVVKIDGVADEAAAQKTLAVKALERLP